MELSKRLQAVANLISNGLRVADVGTDHGYIPIYLIKTGKSPNVIAMDVNKGPILRAKEHVEVYGLQKQIDTRLSDGVRALNEGEVECVVVAGMGGALTIKILEEGESVFRYLKEFVLQPQTEISRVRQFLTENNFRIVAEDMVFEDGKFYPMMRVVNGQSENYDLAQLRFGKLLLEQKHSVLRLFLNKEAKKREQIISNLNTEAGAHIQIRKNEIMEELELIKHALQKYYGTD